MKNSFIIAAVLSTVLISGITAAQEETKTRRMEEVVVSATKTEEERRDIPSSIITKDSYDIQDTGAKTVGQLIANEPGIDLRTRGDYGGASEEIHIRGMGAAATQVLVNGVVINSPSLGTANLNGIPVNNIERIEVVKGAGSLLYGTSAMGGIINIITKRPEKGITDLNLKAGYGSKGTFEVAAQSGMFLTENFGYYLTAGFTETDGFRRNADLEHKDVSLKLVYEKGDMLDVTLYGDYVDREFGRPGPRPPAGTGDFFDTETTGLQLYDSASASLLNRGGDENMSLVLDVSSRPVDRLNIRFRSSYLDIENFNYGRYYSTFPVGVPGSKNWVANNVLGFELNGEIQVTDGLQFLLGSEFKRYDWENTGLDIDSAGFDDPSSLSSASEHLNTRGFFAEGQYRPLDYLKLIAGVRLEKHSEFGKKYVPRFGMIINPHEDTAIKINYGRHFNAPTPNDLFWPLEDWGWGMGAQGNINLRPETGKHADVSFEQSFMNDRVFVNASYFKWDIKNKIRWEPDENYFYQPQNMDTYRGEGVELGVSTGPWNNISMGLSYTYSDSEEEPAGGVRRQAQNTSDNYFKFDLNYFNDAQFGLNISMKYTGDRPGYYASGMSTEPSIVLGSYYSVDVNVQQRFYDNWLVAMRFSNLFDKDYFTYTESFWNNTTGTGSMAKYPGAGRSVFLSVAYEY